MFPVLRIPGGLNFTTWSSLRHKDAATNFSSRELITAASNPNLGSETVFVGATLDLDITRWVETLPAASIDQM